MNEKILKALLNNLYELREQKLDEVAKIEEDIATTRKRLEAYQPTLFDDPYLEATRV